MNICESMEWTGWGGAECVFGVWGLIFFGVIALLPVAMMLDWLLMSFVPSFKVMREFRGMVNDWNGLVEREQAISDAVEKAVRDNDSGE